MNRPLTPAEQAWVDKQVAEAPPLSEEQARLVAAIFSNPLGRAS